MVNWGEKYFDHYAEYFGQVKESRIFEADEGLYSIQILSYENVIDNCMIFASLGLSRYQSETGEIAEVTMTTDSQWEIIPKVIANALFFILHQKMKIGWGMTVGGFENIFQDFADAVRKNSVYITNSFSFPDEICSVGNDNSRGKIYELMLISPQEREFFSKYGAAEFESLIESKEVDPYNINRISCA